MPVDEVNRWIYIHAKAPYLHILSRLLMDSIEDILESSMASLAMEGLTLDQEGIDIARKVLEGTLTIDEAVAIIKSEYAE